ncbi:MAG: hypothetical protein ACHQIK_02125 [Candidatus Acidiferrales bacterium]
MEPQHLRFGGGAAETAIHPLVAVYLLIAIVLIFILPRSKAIAPFLLAFFTIPIGQVVVLGGFHFTALRVLILAGLARRAISRGSSSEPKYPGGFNALDWAVVLWSVSAVVAFCLQWMETQALIRSLGDLLDTLGGYLVVRYLIPDGEAVRRVIKTLATICAILGVCMINEQISHINVFGLVGGIPLAVAVRDGHVRSSGTLGYLWAGAFAGVLIPLFFWLWTEGKSWMAACAGLAGAAAMVITSYSSTSYLALGGSILGLAFWPLRRWMRLVRWGLVTMLVGLHMVMKAPVWALIARIDLTGSSSGDQRYQLVNNCIRHFGDWWLTGYKNYNDWGWGMWDLCNQFVAVALTGGLLTLIFYIAIFSRSFGAIGTARKLVNGDRGQEWLLWCLGSALFATAVAHFGINYMSQLIMGFFPLVACISVVTFEVRQRAARSVETPGQGQFASAPTVTGTYSPIGAPKQETRQGFSTGRGDRPLPLLKA